MSESEEQRTGSPLLSERGVTKISDTVVSSIAGMAAQEVEGVHMGGGTSRAASGVLESITGSESKTGGISVEVGTTETAIDLRMGVEYNKNILQTVEEVRRKITDRVEEMTGLRIKELNATITDITFPEKEQRRRLGSARSTGESDSQQATDTAPETQPESEPETQQAEATPVEPTSRAHTEGSSGPVPEEEVRVEDRPLEEGETAELRTEEQRTDEASEETQEARAETETTYETSAEAEETQETSAEAETTQEARAETETPEEAETRPEPETAETESPEARMRRRAEERARRRRRRSQDG